MRSSRLRWSTQERTPPTPDCASLSPRPCCSPDSSSVLETLTTRLWLLRRSGSESVERVLSSLAKGSQPPPPGLKYDSEKERAIGGH